MVCVVLCYSLARAREESRVKINRRGDLTSVHSRDGVTKTQDSVSLARPRDAPGLSTNPRLRRSVYRPHAGAGAAWSTPRTFSPNPRTLAPPPRFTVTRPRTFTPSFARARLPPPRPAYASAYPSTTSVRTNASATPIAPHANPLRLHGFLDRADPSRATYAVAFEGAIARRALARRVLARSRARWIRWIRFDSIR